LGLPLGDLLDGGDAKFVVLLRVVGMSAGWAIRWTILAPFPLIKL